MISGNAIADETNATHEVFQRVFQALQALSPQGRLLIGLCSALSHSCKIEWASQPLRKLAGRTIDISRGAFPRLLTGSDSLCIVNGADLAASEAAFADLIHGQAALLRVELAGDQLALIVYWQADANGPIATEHARAMVSVAELAGQAACAADLTLDVQAQQLHLETLRTEIEEVQHFYRQFSDAIRQCFWVVDIDSGKLLVVSDNFERVWGADKNILNKGLTGFMNTVFPADRDRVLSEFHTSLGKELDTELRVIAPDGELRWIWLRAFPTRDHLSAHDVVQELIAVVGHEPLRRIVVIADDITEKKSEEESIRAREADLVARARMLAVGDLASGVAHEINNPLTIIVGRAAEVKQALKREPLDIALIDDLADRIQRTSIRIAQIISSLKALSRQEKNIMQRSSLARVINELGDMTNERFRTHGVKLDLPVLPESFTAEFDGTMISQLLLNLLNNAFDAVQRENEKWVKVEFTEDVDSIFLFVTDSGPGIPIKIRSRIFDPFFTTKEPGKGTGLGLSLAAGIAAHHNGMLRLDTMHAHTRFVIQLPRQQPAQRAS